MPIDRRAFVFGSGAASAVGALAPFAAVASVGAGPQPPLAGAALPAVASEPLFELQIVGWSPGEDPPAPTSPDTARSATWIAIDAQWRGAWR